jgi:hypothetical protein
MSKKSRTPRERAPREYARSLGPFPYLTVAQGLHLRDLARRAFAAEGVEVVAHADYLEDPLGRRFGLTNLAAECNLAGPQSVWPAVVTAHVRGILQASADPFLIDELSPEEIVSRVFLRLVNRGLVAEGMAEWLRYARPHCDLLELLVLRSPGSVRYIRDEDVERVGADRMWAAGLENLLQDPFGRHSTRVVDGARIHFVDGDSVHTASRLLTFTDVLNRTVGPQDHPHGLLVAAPSRYELVFYSIDEHLAAATAVLARYAYRSCLEGSGPVSPNVYWWRDGALTRISRAERDGTVEIDAAGGFGDLLLRLSDAG